MEQLENPKFIKFFKKINKKTRASAFFLLFKAWKEKKLVQTKNGIKNIPRKKSRNLCGKM